MADATAELWNIHDRLPVILHPDKHEAWLRAPAEDAGAGAKIFGRQADGRADDRSLVQASREYARSARVALIERTAPHNWPDSIDDDYRISRWQLAIDIGLTAIGGLSLLWWPWRLINFDARQYSMRSQSSRSQRSINRLQIYTQNLLRFELHLNCDHSKMNGNKRLPIKNLTKIGCNRCQIGP